MIFQRFELLTESFIRKIQNKRLSLFLCISLQKDSVRSLKLSLILYGTLRCAASAQYTYYSIDIPVLKLIWRLAFTVYIYTVHVYMYLVLDLAKGWDINAADKPPRRSYQLWEGQSDFEKIRLLVEIEAINGALLADLHSQHA